MSSEFCQKASVQSVIDSLYFSAKDNGRERMSTEVKQMVGCSCSTIDRLVMHLWMQPSISATSGL